MALTLNRPSAPLGVRNAILWARGRWHVVENFPGPLSIKSVSSGTVAWKTGSREMLLDRDSFLVLNHGEPYSMHIDSRQPVTTLCVFFEPGFVESVCGSLAQSDLESATAPAAFLQRLRMADARILPRMQTIANTPLADRLWLDQQFLALAADLAMLQSEVAFRVRLMPARRAATREELFAGCAADRNSCTHSRRPISTSPRSRTKPVSRRTISIEPSCRSSARPRTNT